MRRLLLALLMLSPFASAASAHRASDSFLVLAAGTGGSVRGAWQVSLSDLAYALGLEGSALRWGALRAREAELQQLLRSGLTLETARGRCTLRPDGLALSRLSDGVYAQLSFEALCPPEATIRVSSRLLAEWDRDHRVLLRVGEGSSAQSHVLGRDFEPVEMPASGSPPSALSVFASQLVRGLSHLFEGVDHLAFLLVLLLPFAQRWRAQERPGARWAQLAWLVSAFTLAHSLTLSLSVLGYVCTSPDVIEPAIAASVALAALRNFAPRLAPEGPFLAFSLGLLHGFGFASALSDAGLSGSALAWALFGFNVGVELGQLAFVLAFVPLSLWLLRRQGEAQRALSWGSALVLALSLFWVFERLQTG